ncbi:MAG: phosphoribosyltransferase [bacterium]
MTLLFEDRADAGRRLAQRLARMPLVRPLVLAIPRGGIEVAVPIAQHLGAELDVVLARKLGAPGQPEYAHGALSETGEVVMNPHAPVLGEAARAHLERERVRQGEEMVRRARLFRAARPQAEVTGRSVVLVDDGIATGSTLLASLRAVRARGPREIVVAVPVAPRAALHEVRTLCERLVCLHTPEEFWAVGTFYRDFAPVSDERVVERLAESVRQPDVHHPA